MPEQNSTFAIYAYRFTFRAVEELTFPEVAANIIRGALGSVLQNVEGEGADFFRPRRVQGPSGFADRPRPFVLRAHSLNRRSFYAGEEFAFDIHFFERGVRAIVPFSEAFKRLESVGIGKRRSRVELRSMRQIDSEHQIGAEIEAGVAEFGGPTLRMDFGAEAAVASDSERIHIEFSTPTELKSGGAVTTGMPFGVLLARLFERFSALSLFYGQGLENIDWESLHQRAGEVRTVSSEFSLVEAERQSSRTGQRHSIRGVMGSAIYEGKVGCFHPWLEAGYWTGVGRQTVWGKGVLCATRLG